MPAYGATVYKCTRPDASIYYQAAPCNAAQDIQKVLDCYNRPLTKSEERQIDRGLKQQRKQLLKQRQTKKREAQQAAKQAKAAAKRSKRLETKSAKIKQKIEVINQHYRTGYTIQQGIVLNRKLAEYQAERQKFCSYE